MDAMKKPLKIPPEFVRYAEEKEIFQLLKVNVYNYKALQSLKRVCTLSCLANVTRSASSKARWPARVYDHILEETRYKQ